MSDSYEDVPLKIEWVKDTPEPIDPYKEQLLVMTADRDAWREYASNCAFFKSWAKAFATALDKGDATYALQLAKEYKATGRAK